MTDSDMRELRRDLSDHKLTESGKWATLDELRGKVVQLDATMSGLRRKFDKLQGTIWVVGAALLGTGGANIWSGRVEAGNVQQSVEQAVREAAQQVSIRRSYDSGEAMRQRAELEKMITDQEARMAKLQQMADSFARAPGAAVSAGR